MPAVEVADVEVHVASGVADLDRDVCADLVEHVGEHHLGALGREEARFGLTLAPRGPRDECDLAGETSVRHRLLPRVTSGEVVLRSDAGGDERTLLRLAPPVS